jgi:hypothetical protein
MALYFYVISISYKLSKVIGNLERISEALQFCDPVRLSLTVSLTVPAELHIAVSPLILK